MTTADRAAVWDRYFQIALASFLRPERSGPDDGDVMRAAHAAELAYCRYVSRWGEAEPVLPPERRKPTNPGFRPPAPPPPTEY